MKRAFALVVGFVLLVAVGILLFAWSGVYNIAASRPHWSVVRWVLEFAMRNSVETQSIGVTVPLLEDPALVLRGLGHYAGACSPCHGAPGEARNPVARNMLPEPPYLPEAVRNWSTDELFWIVKHGLKYTGMPAWVAQQRDDEVWAVVAFLRRMPAMEADEYRRLARGKLFGGVRSTEDSAALIVTTGPAGEGLVVCARCHGVRGAGAGIGAFPILTGQREEYLFHALKAYAMGARPSGIMQPIAAVLDDGELRRLARFYAAAEDAPMLGIARPPTVKPPAPAVLELGRKIAAVGVPERGIPPCASCHGLDGRAEGSPPVYPILAGQYPEYLALQLRLWRDGVRGGGAFAQIMAAAVRGATDDERQAVRAITDEEIEAVSLYYALVGR